MTTVDLTAATIRVSLRIPLGGLPCAWCQLPAVDQIHTDHGAFVRHGLTACGDGGVPVLLPATYRVTRPRPGERAPKRGATGVGPRAVGAVRGEEAA